MRWLVLLAVACGSKKDCEVVAAKVRPVIQHMIVAAGKSISDAELDSITSEYCAKPPVSAEDKAARDCILAATSEAATAACLEPEFKAYRDDTAASLERSKARMAKLHAEQEALDREIAQTRAAFPDAGHADAAIDARPAVDVATLPAWPVPAGVHGTGPEVEIDAIDTNIDRLLIRLWDPAIQLLAPSKAGTITGRVVAPSRAAAYAALAQAAGFAPAHVALHGGTGPAVTFSFGGAPAHDLMRILADTLHANLVVVSPTALPHFDIVLSRVPADTVLAALAVALDLAVLRAGKVIYVAPKGLHLPPLPKLAGPSVTLTIRDGTAADAVAAIAAVTKFEYSACGGPATLNLRLTKQPLAEAARAIEVASGVTLTPGVTCPIAEAKLDAKGARLVAIATAGTKSAAIVAHGATTNVVRDGTINADSIGIDDNTALSFITYRPPLQRVDDFIATLQRTSAVIRVGTTWTAIVETATEPVVFEPRAYTLPVELLGRYTISAAGVALDLDREHPIVIPLAK